MTGPGRETHRVRLLIRGAAIVAPRQAAPAASAERCAIQSRSSIGHGAIGTRLVPQLIDAGHEVIGTFRSPGSVERLRALGAEPVALDLLEARAVREAVLASEPEAIVHQATALANLSDFKHFDRSFAETTGFGRRAPTRYEPPRARPAGSRFATAPSTAPSNDELVGPVRKRQFPIVGNGGGVTSFIHLDDAAAATVPRRLEREGQAGANRIARPERGTHRPRRPLRFAQGRPAVADD